MKLFSFDGSALNSEVVYISRNDFVFSRPSKFYNTHISKDGKILLEIKNFFVRHVHEMEDEIILFGFFFNEESFVRKGAIVKLDKDLRIISELKYDEVIFSDFVWGDDRVVCSNCYDDSQDVFNGCIFVRDRNEFRSVKIDPMLYGEYEFRGGIRVSQMNYFFFGVDKDNFRGFVLESSFDGTYLHDVVIDSDFWEIVGVSRFKGNSLIFIGNEWENYSKGFALIFEEGRYEYMPINHDSSWFESLWIASVEGEIFVSIFDFDSNQNCLLRFDNGKFELVEKSEHGTFICSGGRIFHVARQVNLNF